MHYYCIYLEISATCNSLNKRWTSRVWVWDRVTQLSS